MTDRCATRSREAGERPYGTASRARRWILLEQPGPWGYDALASSGLPTEVGAHLRALAGRLPTRVLLIRRPGPRPAPGPRTLLVGVSSPHGGWLEQLTLDDPRDLLDLDLDPLGKGASVGGEVVHEPRYLVCTNGKHDVCCAELGLPVAQAVRRLVGERLWECSHVGGDRFAANLVCLPDGLFYGHLDAGTAAVVVAAHEQGRLQLAHWRGRSSLPFAVQAAEAMTREALGIDEIDGLRVTTTRQDGPVHVVELVTPEGRRLRTSVHEGRDEHARALTCTGEPRHAPTFTLVGLDELSTDPGTGTPSFPGSRD